ncbi:atuA [Sphingomonas sp. DBB INV C78]|uniref:acyclic terpene utilization AtuA family protein n=1 Tax=Sphingomonas sp. DBB INV C78 TaxID=3349434 RepID=UPI0036D417D3
MTDKIVRIGGASAFAMDSALSVPQLLAVPGLDYLIFDYLAEGSMGMMGRAAQASPEAGFGTDFLDVHVGPYLAEILAKKVRVIANAGGVNPHALAAALAAKAKAAGFAPKIGVVAGDDLRERLDEIRGRAPADMFSGAPFPDKVLSANAYLGGFPIARLLDEGADIVITGRVVDSAVVLGALIHEYGWGPDDLDLLAAGTTAGHLLECGAQVTGGTFTDWQDVPDWANIGFPVGECHADGSITITKPEGTGGLVSVGTVAEQMLYEVSDPQAYYVPDVTCDFSTVKLEQVGPNRVRVSGATGHAPTDSYKVCVTYDTGWRGVVHQPVIGINAAAKAQRQAESLFERGRRMLRDRNLPDFRATHYVPIGVEAEYGARARTVPSREVIAKMVVEHDDKLPVDLFLREQYMAISAMSQGTTLNLAAFAMPTTGLFSFLIDKAQVAPKISLDGRELPAEGSKRGGFALSSLARPGGPEASADGSETVPLISLAWGRSGDKGELFNVAVIAREARYLPYIRAALTEASVADWFVHLFEGKEPRVDRYDLPGCAAINFVLHGALPGGINASPRLDPVGKTMAQQLMEFPVPVDPAIAAQLR